MTARKPKPRKAATRKRSKAPTVENRLDSLEVNSEWCFESITELRAKIYALETRKQFRDASHDAPVSNAGEIPPRETAQPSIWRRFLAFMRSP